ncbi:MAG: hypothetical protein LAT75_05855 [Candidatus Cyclonatronum sp.]|uniref:hypothetical protein n=1 Tax=Cyclonatronum sp. TaxID=3024185 RepID=UPI0025C702F7|nr:hypothetical protein [Cyclonatronum sp.]MCH8486370.1 hypothetical protein [Cyclonatronum sp.]
MKKWDITYIEPNNLFLDFKNPRIAEFGHNDKTPEKDIIRNLWETMGVLEIVLSIKASGFFTHEPLFVVEENGKNIVIEGNRRLAAVKSILDPKLGEELHGNRNVFLISEEYQKTLEKLPVIKLNTREDAWKYIGFKHINGAAKWGSYAKAQYISQIKREYGVSLTEIAEQIGDTFKTVQRLYEGLQVIEQAEMQKVFDRTDVKGSRLYFSHLYTGLGYEGIRDYLGMGEVESDNTHPVPEEKKEELKQLLSWIYGSKRKDIEPILKTQNPHLRYLDAILKSSEAVHALKSGSPIEVAFDLSRPKKITFEESLLDAKRALMKAHSYQTEGFDGTDYGLLKQAGTIAELADELYDLMESKWKELESKGSKKRRITDSD